MVRAIGKQKSRDASHDLIASLQRQLPPSHVGISAVWSLEVVAWAFGSGAGLGVGNTHDVRAPSH